MLVFTVICFCFALRKDRDERLLFVIIIYSKKYLNKFEKDKDLYICYETLCDFTRGLSVKKSCDSHFQESVTDNSVLNTETPMINTSIYTDLQVSRNHRHSSNVPHHDEQRLDCHHAEHTMSHTTTSNVSTVITLSTQCPTARRATSRLSSC